MHFIECWLILRSSAQSLRSNLNGIQTSGPALASPWLYWSPESHFAVTQNWNWTTCLRPLGLHTQLVNNVNHMKCSPKTNLIFSLKKSGIICRLMQTTQTRATFGQWACHVGMFSNQSQDRSFCLFLHFLHYFHLFGNNFPLLQEMPLLIAPDWYFQLRLK